MTAERRAALQNIKSFPSLVRYLRDEMDWPIATDDFEDLTFEYSPEELGIDSANAAKIEEIKRLRPLATDQPWGIFFVKFEPKRLPVVALRRILSQVALRKRASANRAERAAWAIEDLLFISSYGEGDARQISFAHFREDRETGNLPALHVLGWDAQDTGLHIDYVADTLTTQLRWPDDDGELDEWREQWRSAFTVRHREVITTSQLLAERLAELAREIRARVTDALEIETASGRLRTLMKAFQEALLHDLDEAGFADMYAQTVAYGLLSARVSRESGALVADDAAALIPVTNPFLREMLESFIHAGDEAGTAGRGLLDFDEVGINEVVATLSDTNMEAVLRDFGDKNPDEDPVIHFYEDFLREYDKRQKVSRGVFYTPRPVVSYIVRSVDELLRTEFGLADGLADTATWGEMVERHVGMTIPKGTSPTQDFVQVLDPATGTGTFLVEVIDVIYSTLVRRWSSEGCGSAEIDRRWNEYVPRHLLTRLHGYELLMAPYAIAHLKIGLKLRETGYRFKSPERARVFLTNALEPAQDFSGQFETMSPALAHEARAVNEIKNTTCFTLVIGNPPYSSLSQNMTTWIRESVDLYKQLPDGQMRERGNRNQLQDDYVKFFRIGQESLSLEGILAFVSNRSYTTGPWFRGMRYQFLQRFDEIRVLDLHGAPSHSLGQAVVDQNVFDIVTPVAVTILTSKPARLPSPTAYYSGMTGSRADKFARLLTSTVSSCDWIELAPTESNQWRFAPHDDAHEDEWTNGISLADVFLRWGAGVLTNRNGLAVGYTPAEVLSRAREFADLSIPDEELEQRYGFSSNYQWTTGEARQDFAKRPVEDLSQPYTFRPFDTRYVYWHKNIVYNMRGDRMSAFLRNESNLGLMFSRNTKRSLYTNVFITRHIPDRHCLEEANVAPLYDVPSDFLGEESGRELNLSDRAIEEFSSTLGRLSDESLESASALSWSPEQAVGYIYALLHSPSYRQRYANFLRIDFPRILMPQSVDLFYELAAIGNELIQFHLLEHPKVTAGPSPEGAYVGKEAPLVGRVGWLDDTVWLDAPKTNARAGHSAVVAGQNGYQGVSEAAWGFHIGGYQVLHKWLKDRTGRVLTEDDVVHYQRMIRAITETIRITADVDDVIETHGGWPGAFLAARGAATP